MIMMVVVIDIVHCSGYHLPKPVAATFRHAVLLAPEGN